MKKSNQVVLTAVLLLAIASCREEQPPQDEWSDGKDAYGRTRDTAIQQGNNVYHYRYFGGGWFPIIGGLINTSRYTPASINDITRPGFTPQSQMRPSGFRKGGFGSSSRVRAGS